MNYIKYFAYGSNMDTQRLKERRVRFTNRAKAILKGYEVRCNKISKTYPGFRAANINLQENGLVEGIVFTIPDEDLSKLNKAEGYSGKGKNNEYEQENDLDVIQTNGTPLRTLIYIANSKKIQEGLHPHPEYLQFIINGAKNIFSPEYIKKLKKL